MPRRDDDLLKFSHGRFVSGSGVHLDAPDSESGRGYFCHPRDPEAHSRDPFADQTLYTQNLAGKKKHAFPTTATTELNLHGDFASGWRGVENSVVFEAAQNQAWDPDGADLKAFAKSGNGTVAGVGDVTALLAIIGNIGRAKPRSLGRVNIFTHAEGGYIGLGGTVERGQKVERTWKRGKIGWYQLNRDAEQNRDLELNGDRLADLAANESTVFSQGDIKNVTMEDVRRAFAPDAQIVIYACHSATDREYLDRVGKVFGVKVRGFSKSIVYVLTPGPDRKLKTTYKIDGQDDKKAVSDFHDLELNL